MSEGTRQAALGPASTDESFSATVAAITSAFGDTTRRQIYLFARERHGVTATEVAEHFALHPNVARHHLDKLAAGGYLDVYVDRDNAGVGRPSKRYLSGTGDATRGGAAAARRPAPRTAWAGFSTIVDPIEAEQIAHEVGAEYGRSLALQMAPGDAPRSLALGHAVGGPRVDGPWIRRAQRGQPACPTPSCGTTVPSAPPPSTTRCCARPIVGLVEGLLNGLCGDGVPVQFSSRARGDEVCSTVAG